VRSRTVAARSSGPRRLPGTVVVVAGRVGSGGGRPRLSPAGPVGWPAGGGGEAAVGAAGQLPAPLMHPPMMGPTEKRGWPRSVGPPSTQDHRWWASHQASGRSRQRLRRPRRPQWPDRRGSGSSTRSLGRVDEPVAQPVRRRRQGGAGRRHAGQGRQPRQPGRATAARGDPGAEARAGRGDSAATDLAEGLGVRRPGPFADLEALRAAAELPVARFAALAGVPGRTYHRRLATLRSGDAPVKGRGRRRPLMRPRPWRRSTRPTGLRGATARSPR